MTDEERRAIRDRLRDRVDKETMTDEDRMMSAEGRRQIVENKINDLESAIAQMRDNRELPDTEKEEIAKLRGAILESLNPEDQETAMFTEFLKTLFLCGSGTGPVTDSKFETAMAIISEIVVARYHWLMRKGGEDEGQDSPQL